MKKNILAILAAAAMTAVVGCAGSEQNNDGTDTFRTDSGKTVVFHPLGHGSLYVTLGDETVYFDPVIAMLPEGGDFSGYPKADYIFVTHSHFDHLDTLAIAQLTKESTHLVSNVESAAMLEGAMVVAPGNWLKFDNFSVEVVPAYNISEDKQNFHPKGRDNGYVIDYEGFRTYVAGDTEDIPELADLHDIDVALLPCNLPFTMTPEQLSSAARKFMPKVLFPYHYGDTDIDQTVTLLSDTPIDVRIRQYR